MILTYSDRLTLRATLEPIPGFHIELTGSRSFIKNENSYSEEPPFPCPSNWLEEIAPMMEARGASEHLFWYLPIIHGGWWTVNRFFAESWLPGGVK